VIGLAKLSMNAQMTAKNAATKKKKKKKKTSSR
jgi:hypothetical protein